MKQVFVRGKQVVLQEVNPPPLDARGILVETRAAAISTGTETSGLHNARQNMLTRLQSPEMQSKIYRRWQSSTLWPAVRKKLGFGAPVSPAQLSLGSPTGYSCAGKVLEIGEFIQDVQPGERVACAGSPHAQVIYAPKNLYVPIPKNVSNIEASFVAIGSIALHAVRQAQLTMGEIAVVMGSGIVGQFVAQIIEASGARSIVLDLVPERVALAKKMGASFVLNPQVDDVTAQVLEFTAGLGVDAVLLCMSGASEEPIQQALNYVRDKGRLVIVGTPKMNIPRAPFYRKEVDLRIARSYGPGRYDPSYEEDGNDYPPGYIRWTERRNMAEFLRLVAEKKVNVASLVTHQFPWNEAAQAYETALGNNAKTLGIVLTSDLDHSASTPLPSPPAPDRQISVGVIGAGSFTRAFHLPNLSHNEMFKLQAVVAKSQKSARRAANEFGVQDALTDLDRLLSDQTIDLVVIATPHNLHAQQTVAALKAGKAVFCEKPVGMSPEEVERVVETVWQTGSFYAVGFNRRFAPTVVRARELLDGHKGPLILNYRIAGTFLPADHWVYDPKIGGGRIIGEACHFFDLLNYFVRHKPVELTAVGGDLSHPGKNLDDNAIFNMGFEDGSIATLVYSDLGHPQFPKERLEIFAGEGVLVIDDFRELKVSGFSGQRGMQLTRTDKGHRSEIDAIGKALLAGKESPISVQDGKLAMDCAFQAVQLLQERRQ